MKYVALDLVMFHGDFCFFQIPSLKLTAKAPKNRWLEYYFPSGEAYFQGLLLLVSGRVNFFTTIKKHHRPLNSRFIRLWGVQRVFYPLNVAIHVAIMVINGVTGPL